VMTSVVVGSVGSVVKLVGPSVVVGGSLVGVVGPEVDPVVSVESVDPLELELPSLVAGGSPHAAADTSARAQPIPPKRRNFILPPCHVRLAPANRQRAGVRVSIAA
jgi:hypothetical protein